MTRTSVVDYAAGTLLGVVILGQLAFFIFLTVFYTLPALAGDLLAWNANVLLQVPPVISGQPVDTVAFGFHAIGASLISLIGGLQLIPWVRKHYPAFHRFNGRLFMLTVIALSLSGFYLVWIRGPRPDALSELGTSVNGLLILSFVVLAFNAIRRRRFADHERWATRLFLVSHAQWFLRIGGFGFFVLTQSLGFEVGFENPFFQFWVWGCFLVPLVMTELFFRTHRSPAPLMRWASASVFIVMTPLAAFGIFAFTAFLVQLTLGNVPAG